MTLAKMAQHINDEVDNFRFYFSENQVLKIPLKNVKPRSKYTHNCLGQKNGMDFLHLYA